MASIEKRNETYHIIFRYGGKKFSRSLETGDEATASNRQSNLERTIQEVNEGRRRIPPDADPATFLLSNGEISQPHRIQEKLTLKRLLEEYFAAIPEGSRDETTLYGMHVHERHLLRILGEGFDVQALSIDDLQRFIDRRHKEKVGANTINKPIVTLRTVWNWGIRTKRLIGRFPSGKELMLPKDKELPPFMTWDEIERKIEKGRLSTKQQAKMWDALYLRQSEVEELLDYVQTAAKHPFIYPMFVMAAHTGCRRSELLRSQVEDFDDGVVLIREKKRVRGKNTTRRVPMSSRLKDAMEEWMSQHPGGGFTFCLPHIARSRIDKGKTLKRTGPEPISRDEAHDHFERTLKGSKWEKLKGWHALRHSFISILASDECDQRLIDDYVGHTTDQQRRRYRHLLPEAKASAIRSVFG